MRIALVTPGFSADEQDWCIPALLNLAQALARDHDVHVFTLRYPHRRATYDVYGATVHALGGADTRGTERIWLLQRAIRRIRREHRSKPFDVIHGFWADEPGFVAVASGRFLGVPTIVSVMGGELVSLPDIQYGGQLGRMNRWLTRIAIRRATRVTVGSRYLERIVHARGARRVERPCSTGNLRAAGTGTHGQPVLSLPKDAPLHGDVNPSVERCRLLPLGVDTDLFYPCAQSGAHGGAPRPVSLTGHPAILSVGSLVPVKDHETLLRAMVLVAEVFPDAHLHLVGDGLLRANLEQLAASAGLADRVTFHGEVTHDRLPDYYRAADLLVVSSRHESQCMVALEAAACGCPVIGTAVGILPELSPDSTEILAGDATSLARGMTDVLRDDEKRSQLSHDALALVRSRYWMHQTVPQLLALYGELSGSREHP